MSRMTRKLSCLHASSAAHAYTGCLYFSLVCPLKCCVVLAGMQGETVLHAAAQWGHPRVVDLLLSNGANPNAMFKVSPFHC